MKKLRYLKTSLHNYLIIKEIKVVTFFEAAV